MSLANLIAKQKAKEAANAEQAQPVQSVAPSSNDSNDAGTRDTRASNDSPASNVVAATQESALLAATTSTKPRFGVKPSASAQPAVSGGDQTNAVPPATGVVAKFSRFKTGGVAAASAEPQPRPESVNAGNGSVGGELAALADSEEGQALERKRSLFDDEVAADAPIRELGELSEQQRKFAESLDSVYEVVHEPEMLGKVIRNIMLELAENPEYRKLIQPVDVRTMIKGMRDSMGMARVKKQEKKRSTGGSAKPSKAIDADMLADLDALGNLED